MELIPRDRMNQPFESYLTLTYGWRSGKLGNNEGTVKEGLHTISDSPICASAGDGGDGFIDLFTVCGIKHTMVAVWFWGFWCCHRRLNCATSVYHPTVEYWASVGPFGAYHMWEKVSIFTKLHIWKHHKSRWEFFSSLLFILDLFLHINNFKCTHLCTK